MWIALKHRSHHIYHNIYHINPNLFLSPKLPTFIENNTLCEKLLILFFLFDLFSNSKFKHFQNAKMNPYPKASRKSSNEFLNRINREVIKVNFINNFDFFFKLRFKRKKFSNKTTVSKLIYTSESI